MSQTEKALREALDTLVAVVGLTAFKYEGQRKPLQEAIDNARAALSLPETQGEPVAYLYTLEYGSDVANRMVSIEKLNYPFGVCGSDYLAKNDKGVSYVRQTPLYAAPPSQPAQGEWQPLPDAAPAAPAQEGWQPIETAPKDNGPMLIAGGHYCFDSGIGTAKTVNNEVALAYWDRFLNRFDEGYGDESKFWYEPTHWMPLPPKPTNEEGA